MHPLNINIFLLEGPKRYSTVDVLFFDFQKMKNLEVENFYNKKVR